MHPLKKDESINKIQESNLFFQKRVAFFIGLWYNGNRKQKGGICDGDFFESG